MKWRFWLNVCVIFTLFFSLIGPAAAAFAEGENTSIVLKSAEVTEEGVSLKWETAGDLVTASEQSFQIERNGVTVETAASKINEESTDTKHVYGYIDQVEAEAANLEYYVVWSVNGQSYTSNAKSVNLQATEELQEPEELQESEETQDSDESEESEESEESQSEEPSNSEVSADEETQIAEEDSNELQENEAVDQVDPLELIKDKGMLQQEETNSAEESFLFIETQSINENGFSVIWDAYIDRQQGRVSKYELYLDEVLIKTTNTRNTDHKFTNLQPDTTYKVAVKAFNSSDALLLEESMEVNTLPAPTGGKANIADANLLQAIKDHYGVTRDIFESDLENLTMLEAAGYGITSLAGLEKAVNLKVLHVYSNDITDITPLASLTKLTYLDIEDNNISNIAPLKSLSELHTLWLSFNPIKNIGALQSLTNIEFLFLHRTKINNIDVLLELPYLTHLTLEGTPLDLSEGSAASRVIEILKDAGVYIDIIDEYMYDYLDVYAQGTSEESILLSWWYNFREEEDYYKEYSYEVSVDGKLYKKTTETELNITGLKPETQYEFKVKMFDEDGTLMTEALAMGTTLPLPTGEIVSIPDKNLEMAIRENLYLPKRAIFESDMQRLDMLFAPGYGIKSLKGLEAAINLEHLYLNDNEISDLTPLKNLEYLSFLSIGSNNIKNLKPLSGLYLYYLDISDNPMTDLSALAGLVDLEVLLMHYLPATDISVLLDIEYLQFVTLFGLEKLTFEPGTPEMLVVEELINRGVEVILNEEDFYGISEIWFNVLDITHNSIELEWVYEGEEEVAKYGILLDGELIDMVEDGYYFFADLEAETYYDIAVIAFDEEEFPIDYNEITLSTTSIEDVEEDKDQTPVPGKKPGNTQKGEDKKDSSNQNKGSNNGNKLPVTATNTLNFILIGFGLLLVGLMGMLYVRKYKFA